MFSRTLVAMRECKTTPSPSVRPMRILLCTKNDLPALVAANHLADALRGHEVFIWLSDKTRSAEREQADLDLMRFFERELPMRWLLPEADARGLPPAPGQLLSFPTLAASLGSPITVVPRLSAVAGRMRALQPDLVVSVRFSHIFPAELIGVPKHGILNVHPGYLPEFGGLYTPFHQMAAGRSRIGVTLHRVDEGIDTGPIVDMASIPVDPQRSLLWHVAETYPAALPALRAAIERLARGEEVAATAQDPVRRRYYALPSTDEMAAFQRRFRLASPADFADIMARFGVGPDCADAAMMAAPQAAAR